VNQEELEKQAISSVLRGIMRSRAGRDVARRAAKSRGAPSAARKIMDRAPEGFAKGISEPDIHKAWAGYKHQGSQGTESLLASVPSWISEKVVGKEKTRDFFWKHVHKPALQADTAAGHALGKIPGAKGLFTTTDKVPWGPGMHKDIHRSSALAPLSKIRDIGAPIIVGVGLEKGLKKITGADKKTREEHTSMQDQGMREKVASTMLKLHEENKGHTKRAQALKLFYKKAELGMEQIPQTYHELEIKIASLETQDLVVLEKALELAGGHFKLGEIDYSTSHRSVNNATEKFQADVLGDEL
jgi:hypothetical protein